MLFNVKIRICKTSVKWSCLGKVGRICFNLSPSIMCHCFLKVFLTGLCDENDPEVGDIDDVVGLCSGQFVSQPVNISSQSQASQSQASLVGFFFSSKYRYLKHGTYQLWLIPGFPFLQFLNNKKT